MLSINKRNCFDLCAYSNLIMYIMRKNEHKINFNMPKSFVYIISSHA